ncbi:MAG TPA: FtsQ-type POTRA domain-containing protein [Acidimicrobiales bacterium]|nr:FtsQ-type POTRA domain-containing protein [Acidimicrobiales bacterium]
MTRSTTEKLPINPRIRQRRVQVIRDQGRKRLIAVEWTSGILFAVAAIFGLAHSSFIGVKNVQITGSVHESREAIESQAGITQGSTPMIDANPAQVSHRIDQMPWVASTVTVRHWPWSISIFIKERTAVGMVFDRNGALELIDGSGRVLGPANQSIGLPMLTGVPVAPKPGRWIGKAAKPALTVAAALGPNIKPGISRIELGGGGTVDLQWGSETTVILGNTTDLAAKLDSLVTLLAKGNLRGATRIDLEVPNLPTVGP